MNTLLDKLLLCFYFFLLCLNPLETNAQVEKTFSCGTYEKKEAKTRLYETDYIDRFGNLYNKKELFRNSNRNVVQCNSPNNVFDLVLEGSFTVDEETVICNVFAYIESEVISSSQSPITIKVEKGSINKPNAFAVGSPFYVYPGCGVNHSLVWERVNTANTYPSSPYPENLTGYIVLEETSASDWYTGTDPSGIDSDEIDLFTIVLHEALHVLGFASQIGVDGIPVDGFYTLWDKHLFSNNINEYVLENSNVNWCCDAKELNSLIPSLDGLFNLSCSPSADVVFWGNRDCSGRTSRFEQFK